MAINLDNLPEPGLGFKVMYYFSTFVLLPIALPFFILYYLPGMIKDYLFEQPKEVNEEIGE